MSSAIEVPGFGTSFNPATFCMLPRIGMSIGGCTSVTSKRASTSAFFWPIGIGTCPPIELSGSLPSDAMRRLVNDLFLWSRRQYQPSPKM